MRLHALLVPAFFVLHARAASIPDSVPLLEERLATKLVDKTLLRDAQTEIPVKVIEDSQPADNSVYLEDENYQVKRAEVDLNNLSLPQHQNEHDTQSPEEFDDEKISESTIKQSLSETQNAFNQGLQTISQNIQKFITNNEQVTALQTAITNMRQSLAEQVDKLNLNIRNYWKPQGSNTRSTFDANDKNSPIYRVQSDLKNLEEKFEEGLNNLSTNVQRVSNFRQNLPSNTNEASTESTSGTTAATGSPSLPNFFQGLINNFQNFTQQWNQGFSNIQNIFNPANIQNIFNPAQQSQSGQGAQPNGSPQNSNGTAGPQSFVNDIWQNIQTSFQNIFNPSGQGSTQTQPPSDQNSNNPFIQNPIFQGVANFFNPNRQQATSPAATTVTVKPGVPSKTEGTNVVPSESSENDSVDHNKKVPTVQRIQGSVTPVETFKTAADVDTAEGVAAQGDLKYGFGAKPGHGGGGDNNDSNGSRVKDIPLEVDATPAPADVQPVHLDNTEEAATDHGRSLKRLY